jgi:hypothetical protein
MLRFDEKKIVGVVNVPLNINEEMIGNIIIGSIEGGSNYWMGLDNTGSKWNDKPKGEPLSTWATKIILEGGSVEIFDYEEFLENDSTDGLEIWSLTLDKILEGIKLNALKRPWDCDLENGDAQTDDCIIQYALFGEIVYG